MLLEEFIKSSSQILHTKSANSTIEISLGELGQWTIEISLGELGQWTIEISLGIGPVDHRDIIGGIGPIGHQDITLGQSTIKISLGGLTMAYCWWQVVS